MARLNRFMIDGPLFKFGIFSSHWMAGVCREHVARRPPNAAVHGKRSPRATGRYSAAMSAPLCRAIFPTMRWRVMRTFTPAWQAPVGCSAADSGCATGQGKQPTQNRLLCGDHIYVVFAKPPMAECCHWCDVSSHWSSLSNRFSGLKGLATKSFMPASWHLTRSSSKAFAVMAIMTRSCKPGMARSALVA